MIDITSLRALRGQRFFAAWDGSVAPDRVADSEESIRRLIDALIELGPTADEIPVRRAVHDCVERFNSMDQGWICSLEREDICDVLGRVVECCGLSASADWIAENREW